MILSTPLSRLFVPHDPAVQLLAKRMFILNFTFLIPNVFYNIFLQAYRAQNRMHLVNVMSFAETTMIGLFTLFAVKQFGSDAAWISNTLIDIVCIFILYISVIFYRRKIDFSYPAMLKLPETFGANDKEFLAFSIKTIEEVEASSEKIMAFCEQAGRSKSQAYHVALCTEEMAGNVIQHGFTKGKNRFADIRIVTKGENLTLRIRDNCKEFDPRERAELFDPEHPESNVGIRLAMKVAKQVDFYNNAGINTLIMKF